MGRIVPLKNKLKTLNNRGKSIMLRLINSKLKILRKIDLLLN